VNDRKLLFIRWIDARGVGPEWQDLNECEKEEMKDYVIESVGFVIRETVTAIHITPHIEHKEGHFCGDMQIPKSAIIDKLEISDHKPISTDELHQKFISPDQTEHPDGS